MRFATLCAFILVGFGLPRAAEAAPVLLLEATATFSQTVFLVAQTVDDIVTTPPSGPGSLNGWAILDSPNTSSETAVWETAVDLNATLLSIALHQNFLFQPGHMIGRFRLSVTTDDRSTFADGLATGGDVTAGWTVLTSPSVTGPAGVTFSILGDSSVLVGGATVGTGTYAVEYAGSFTGITGLRLEVLEDPSLPTSGPGRYPNGNFVLTEVQLDAVLAPEPASVLLLAVAILASAAMRRPRA